MEIPDNAKCPKCGAGVFINLPNRYDYLKFIGSEFRILNSSFTNDKERIFCRECGAEVNEVASIENNKVILN
jgi:rubredoxin